MFIKKIEDGVVITSPIPVGIGKLAYFLNKNNNLINNTNYDIIPGVVMQASSNSTTLFILGNNNKVSKDSQILILKDASGKFINDFVINLEIKDILGACINPLGKKNNNPNLDLNLLKVKNSRLPKPLNGISDRLNVWKPLLTGVKVVDFLFPIGLGQRQLIIGDRNTGKSTIAIDSIIAQKKTSLKCIYVSIGQKRSSIKKLLKTLKKHDSMHYSIIIHADSSDPVSLQFLAPFTGCTIGEIFSGLGGDSLVIYDDLSKHAVAYRQMALLLKKSPGRDAFPSDIFYLHANLLERAGQFFSGSLTALPIVETLARDVSAYIPTNIISITDGQLFLDADYFNKGYIPAVHTSLSVSRVGSKSQIPSIGIMSKWLKSVVNEFREIENLINFSDDMDKITISKLNLGLKTCTFLCQLPNQPVDVYDELLLLGMLYNGTISSLKTNQISLFIEFLIKYSNEFLYRDSNYLIIINELGGQKWFINFADKNFMTSDGFKQLSAYVLTCFLRVNLKK